MSGSEAWRSRRLAGAILVVAVGLFTTGCKQRQSSGKPRGQATVSQNREKPELTRRSQPPAPLEQFVQQHVEEADVNGKRVLVYVGAAWCEPCKRFHQALESGELDAALAGTNFIEFDADRDRKELQAAGYASKYIPSFSVPDHSGHASGRAIEGSITGDRAVRETLVPRLLALLDGKPTQ